MALLAAPHNDYSVLPWDPNAFHLLQSLFGFINIPYKKMKVNGFFLRLFFVHLLHSRLTLT